MGDAGTTSNLGSVSPPDALVGFSDLVGADRILGLRGMGVEAGTTIKGRQNGK
jgi:hypothetical protein